MCVYIYIYVCMYIGFPDGSVVRNLPAEQETWVWFPGLGRSPGEENGNPLQYSCLENPMDRGPWWSTVQKVTKSQAQLRDWKHTHTHTFFKRILFTQSSLFMEWEVMNKFCFYLEGSQWWGELGLPAEWPLLCGQGSPFYGCDNMCPIGVRRWTIRLKSSRNSKIQQEIPQGGEDHFQQNTSQGEFSPLL